MTTKVDRWTYEELESAVSQLRKSERGQRALANIHRLCKEGGTGLDYSNKSAAMKLLHAMFFYPWDLPVLTPARVEELSR